jgi:chromosomal replication initiation ATPase DnaA
MTQSAALDILKMGKNVFLTGGAGAGKTYVLNALIKYYEQHDVPIAVTASYWNCSDTYWWYDDSCLVRNGNP